MGNQAKIDQLTAEFTRFGASDPEGWARSEVVEDIPQLARYLFLNGAWACAVDPEDDSWIDRTARTPSDDRSEPVQGSPDIKMQYALGRMLDAGIERSDIHLLVREMQAELLYSLCWLLEGSHPKIDNPPTSWALFELDENHQPARSVNGLYESLNETDPSSIDRGA